MGRRSRKRGGSGRAAGIPADPPARPAAAAEGRPRAPWHPFPLVELSVLVGLALLVWGLLRRDDEGRVLLVCGMALASLGGLDTALREHFGGHRPHALLLAALPAVATAGALFFARAPWSVAGAAAVAVLAGGFALLRRAFRRRS